MFGFGKNPDLPGDKWLKKGDLYRLNTVTSIMMANGRRGLFPMEEKIAMAKAITQFYVDNPDMKHLQPAETLYR